MGTAYIDQSVSLKLDGVVYGVGFLHFLMELLDPFLKQPPTIHSISMVLVYEDNFHHDQAFLCYMKHVQNLINAYQPTVT